MAHSKGSAKSRGHSKGPFGHGGVHSKGGSVTAHGSNSPHSDHLRSMVARGSDVINGTHMGMGGGPGIAESSGPGGMPM